MNTEAGSVIVSKTEILQTLQDLNTLLREYGTMMERVWDFGSTDPTTEGLLRTHQAQVQALARSSDSVFARMVPVAVLFRYFLEHLKREQLTFRLSGHNDLVPEKLDPQLTEWAELLGQLQRPLEAFIADVTALAATEGALSRPRVHMWLLATASLFKGVLRQDWEDVDLVMNHINLVTTSRDSHQLVQQVAQIIRNIYNSFHELSQDYTLESLSHTTTEIPDAVERLHHVITQLEDCANRNLDILEALSGKVREDTNRADSALRVLQECDEELAGLMEEHPHLGDDLRDLRERLSAGVASPLQSYKSALNTNHEGYMALFANQSFHDLTGQTLKKVIAFIESLQYQLIQVITKDTAAPHSVEKSPYQKTPHEQGPDASNRLSQDKVDNLLADLGF